MNTETNNQRPQVGIGVMIFKNGKVLLGKRKSTLGADTYAWPGGHMEYMESFADCAKRETMEEAGIEIQNIRLLRLMNFKTCTPKHYVDIGLVADWKSGEPQVMEPNKCGGWDWYDLEHLPQPLFDPVPNYIEAYKTGRNYFDT